jgi:sigma-B regulation protein RsbU (phosphoserine phosphatase)
MVNALGGLMDTHRVTGDRATLAAAALASAWLLVVAVVDVALPSSVVPDTLFAIAALIACSLLPPRATAGFAGAAIVLVVASGWWNDTWDTAQQWVRFLDVVLVGTAGVMAATVRVHRERRLTRLAAIAETAQRAILPTVPPATESLKTASRYISAAEDAVVGGDLYDCSLTEGYTRFIVGDVRGKGLAAVEQAARVIRAFRQSAAAKAALTDAARDMNHYLTPFLGDEEFVTALLVDLTCPDTITLTSCGHPPAILIRANGEAAFLELAPGLPLGIGDATGDSSFAWAPGDRVLMYTDGLSEARDAIGEFLPLLGLAPVLSRGSLEEALEWLLGRVRDHVPSGKLGDDLALLLLENTTQRVDSGRPVSPPQA